MKRMNMRDSGVVIVLITLVVLACNFPSMLKKSAQDNETTTPEAGLTIVFPTATLAVTDKTTPAVTSTASTGPEDACLMRAAFVADVTVPDNTVFDKGESFVKTWRIRNSGTCSWETGTIFAFLSGDELGDAPPVSVPPTDPGSEIELSINMQAPSESGTFRSNWQMLDPQDKRFGGVFYVQIVVEEVSTPEPGDESWNPPENFIGKTSVDCKQIEFTWSDGTGEDAYIISGSAISVALQADTTSYIWQNPPTNTSAVTLTAKGSEAGELAHLQTVVNVNCGSERPNLFIQKISFEPQVPVAHLPLTVTVQVRNKGPVDSGAFVAGWGQVKTQTDISCEWFVNDGLPAGKNTRLSCPVDPYSSVNDFVMRGEVDVTQTVVESDEIDNTLDDTVSVVQPAVFFDFVDEAPGATWTAGPPEQTLVWPGTDTDNQGYARWITGELENDEFASDSILQTHPRWQANGWVQGTYTNMSSSGYTVHTGDLFSASVAFLKGAVEGSVTYKIMIHPEAGSPAVIAELTRSYGEGVKPIKVDLTPYAGQKASFILRVEAGVSANYDWACWVNAVIYRYP